MFGHHWEKARGTVISSRAKSTTGDGMVTIREYIVDVDRTDGRRIRALVQEPRLAMDFWPPSPGDVVGVEVGAKDDEVRFDKSDPQLSTKARRKMRDDSFRATLHRDPGTGDRG